MSNNNSDKHSENKTEISQPDVSKTVANSKETKKGRKRKTTRNRKNTIIGSWIRNEYKILEKIGQGGMGEVYLALDKKTGETVAIKLLFDSLSKDKAYVNRFKKEISIGQKLNNEHIVKIMASGTLQGRYYAVMEYAKGITLRKYIDQARDSGEKIPIEEINSIVLQIAHALSYAYKNGVVAHRDIKPENIIIDTKTKHIKVMDFGIAKLGSADISKSATSNIFTLTYASPEQLFPTELGVKQIDQRTDIYSLGLIFYEMLTGKLPFNTDGTTTEVIASKIAAIKESNSVPIPSDVPEYVQHILRESLAKNPSDRYSSIDELIQDLENKSIGNEETIKSYSITFNNISEKSKISVDGTPIDFSYEGNSAKILLPQGNHSIVVSDEGMTYKDDLYIDNDIVINPFLSKERKPLSENAAPSNNTKTQASAQSAKPKSLLTKFFISIGFLILIDAWFYYGIGYLYFYKQHRIHISKHLNFSLNALNFGIHSTWLDFLAFLSAISIFVLLPEMFLLPILLDYLKKRTPKIIKKSGIGAPLVLALSIASISISNIIKKTTFTQHDVYKLLSLLSFGMVRYFLLLFALLVPIILIFKYITNKYWQISHSIKYISWWILILILFPLIFLSISNVVTFQYPNIGNTLRWYIPFSPSITFLPDRHLMFFLAQVNGIDFLRLILTIIWVYTLTFLFPIMLVNDLLSTFWKRYKYITSNVKLFWISTLLGFTFGSLRLIAAAQENIPGVQNFVFYSVYYFFIAFGLLIILNIYRSIRRITAKHGKAGESATVTAKDNPQ